MAENFFDFQERVTRRKKPAPASPVNGGGPAPAAPGGREPVSVTQLTAQIDKALKAGVPAAVLVRGEVSNFKLHGASGHAYFTLKDGQNCVDCVMWRADAARLKFKPGDGMELLADGRVSVYGSRGKYQLYVTALQPLGQGALELAYRQLYAKLEAQGLFAQERKKPLPAYPARLALVTSKETAAVQDMLKVLRRYRGLRLFIYHVPVQGDGAAERIAAAIEHLNARGPKVGGIDLILLGRGGGSLEDLWEFNEEVVARAVAASGIPVVTGIGHEVDTSIADWVADHHAHTPTEAAQVAVQHWRTAKDSLDSLGIRLRREMRNTVQDARHRLKVVERHDFFRRPAERVNQLRQLLDDRQRALALAVGNGLRAARRELQSLAARFEAGKPLGLIGRLRERLSFHDGRLSAATAARVHAARERLSALSARMQRRHPRHLTELARQGLGALAARLGRSGGEDLARRTLRLRAAETCLRAVSPDNVLQRGYTLTRHKNTGQIVRSASALAPGERIVTQFADGVVTSAVDDPNQLGLFE